MGKERKDTVEEKDRILVAGRPAYNRTDNMVKTSKYTAITFIPVVSFLPEVVWILLTIMCRLHLFD